MKLARMTERPTLSPSDHPESGVTVTSNDSSIHLPTQYRLHHHAGHYSSSHQDYTGSQENSESRAGREIPGWGLEAPEPPDVFLEIPGAILGLGYSEES